MRIVDKVLSKVGLMEPEEESFFEQEEERRERSRSYTEAYEKKEESAFMNHDNNEETPRKVVDFQSAASARENTTMAKMKVMVIEPKSFDDAQQVANDLREKKPVVINFEKTDATDAKRIVDFISGTTYALNGEIKKIGNNVFLCAPSNVNVSYMEEERKVSTEMPWLKK